MEFKARMQSAGWALVAGAALAVCLLANLQGPNFPGAGLDPSWMMTTRYAVEHGLVFGRDYVFTYGPLSIIATRLFDPQTFWLVIVYDIFAILAMFWLPLRSRSTAAVVALGLCVLVLGMGGDSLAAATVFAVFLMAVSRREVWSFAFVALCAPLVLSKLSFGLALLPLMLLADARWLVQRRPPLFTATLLAACLAAYLTAGQPLAALPDFLRNTLEIVLGYGRAMQISGSATELICGLAVGGVILVFTGVRAWLAARGDHALQRSALFAGWLGLAWVLFIAMKMGFVRHDGHALIFHLAAPALLAIGFAGLKGGGRDSTLAVVSFLVTVALTLGSAAYWKASHNRPSPAQDADVGRTLSESARNIGKRLQTGVSWIDGSAWEPAEELNALLLSRLASEAPKGLQGSVDAIPTDLSEIIAAGYDYRPRPVVQSYSSYTPRLQALDQAHFEGPRAPDNLFLRIEDIDNRLPTLATGPSLPVIGQRYDAVGLDRFGVLLRRRDQPRPMTVRQLGGGRLAFGGWTQVPSRPDALVMAAVTVERTPLGKLFGFLHRDVQLRIELRTESGRIASYRFIPGMAELGFAVSPLATGSLAPLVLLDPTWATRGERITALRLVADQGWAIRHAAVTFSEVALQPGFAGGFKQQALLADLAASDPTREAVVEGDQVFAHAPTELSLRLPKGGELSGAAGLRPQPAGSAPGDGVAFEIVVSPANGPERAVFSATVRPGEPPAVFHVKAPAGATVRLRTATNGGREYDWSYWGGLAVKPAG